MSADVGRALAEVVGDAHLSTARSALAEIGAEPASPSITRTRTSTSSTAGGRG